jgi:thiamine-monophosphate kinase
MRKKPFSVRQISKTVLDPLRKANLVESPFLSTGKAGETIYLHHEVEGVGIEPAHTSPFEMGKKSASVALFRTVSAGMKPNELWVTVGVNQATTDLFWEEVFRGLEKACKDLKVDLRFVHSTHSPSCFFISIAVLAQRLTAMHPPKIGDLIAVSRTLGDALAGLQCLKRFGLTAARDYEQVVARHVKPSPPNALCLSLGSKFKTSFRPLIDGLASELHRFCETHDLGACIQEKEIPISKECREAASYLGMGFRNWALFGPEDYGLLLTVRPEDWKRASQVAMQCGESLKAIGEVRPQKDGVALATAEGELVSLANRSWNPILRRKTN